MTIKELASFTGKTERTIRTWIKKAGDKIAAVPREEIAQGISHGYTIEEVESILNSGSMSKDAIAILMQNARQQPHEIVSQGVDYEMIGKMIGMAVAAAMTPVVKQLEVLNSKSQLQIEAPKEDFFSLVAYCSLHNIKTNRSELAMHGRELRNLAKSKNLIIRKIPDERWGQVNSYPVEILTEYFAG